MNWKRFITASISSSVAILFPYNIIGCAGGDPDPYDYYVNFFQQKINGDKALEPFLYTNYRFLYDSQEPVSTAELLSEEWSDWSKNSFSKKDAYSFLINFSEKEINQLYQYINKKTALKVPDSVKANKMTQFFLNTNNQEALRYLVYTKKLEPLVTATWNSWEPVERDQVKMNALITEGQELLKTCSNPFLQLRYGYQLVRLAHYNDRYEDCISYYDAYIKNNKEKSVLHDLSVSLKAGAHKRLGQNQIAAYLFSQLFANTDTKKVANYLSFVFATSRFSQAERDKNLIWCKNGKEKAAMLGLYALGSNASELATLQKIYQLDPTYPKLSVLVTRELNKLEEYYYTPTLNLNAGRAYYNYSYEQVESTDSTYLSWQKNGKNLLEFCELMGKSNDAKKGFYTTAAAHTAYVIGNFSKSQELINLAQQQFTSDAEKDQLLITQILVTLQNKELNETQKEAQLVKSLEWMEQKSKKDIEFAKFARRILTELMAPYYKSTNNRTKQALCYGVADKIQKGPLAESWGGYFPMSIQFIRDSLSGKQAEEFVAYLNTPNKSAYEQFLIKRSEFTKNDLLDVAGTAYLREFEFKKAAEWFQKIPASYYKAEPYKSYLAANPFSDLLNDTHSPTKQDTVKYTKLSFAKKMDQLLTKLIGTKVPEEQAKISYELAKGYYNMSYWGNSWLLVRYSWSTGETYDFEGQKRPSAMGDYYTVQKAKNAYLKAKELSLDKNFQAKCLYMAAKCDQKVFGNIPYMGWDDEKGKYNKELRKWIFDFNREYKYYSQLKQYQNTPFYKEAFNTCVYLRDFVKAGGK